jgi:hypothetical protein
MYAVNRPHSTRENKKEGKETNRLHPLNASTLFIMHFIGLEIYNDMYCNISYWRVYCNTQRQRSQSFSLSLEQQPNVGQPRLIRGFYISHGYTRRSVGFWMTDRPFAETEISCKNEHASGILIVRILMAWRLPLSGWNIQQCYHVSMASCNYLVVCNKHNGTSKRKADSFLPARSSIVTVQLTPWSRVLPEKLTRPELLKKFPAFYGTRRFITVFTTARHLSLSWTRSIQSTNPPPQSQLSKFHFNIILPSTPGSFKWSPSLRFPH